MGISQAQNFLEQCQALFKAVGERDLGRPEQEKGVRRGKTLESCVLGKAGDEVGCLWNRTEKAKERAQEWAQGAMHPLLHLMFLSTPPPSLQEGVSREFLWE